MGGEIEGGADKWGGVGQILVQSYKCDLDYSVR